MPISKTKIAKEWNSNLKATAEKDARIASLEAEIHCLKMKNGSLLDDVGDDYTNNEKNIIENAELKVRNEFLTKKCANLEVRCSESNDTLAKIRGKVSSRLGKSGYKKFMSDIDLNDDTSNKITAALENPNPPPKTPQKSTSKASKRPNEPASKSKINTNTPKKNCGSKSIDDEISKSLEKINLDEKFDAELINIIAFILYGFSVANEGNHKIVVKVQDAVRLAKKGREKIEKNRHFTSIDAIFQEMIKVFKEMTESVQQLDQARKVLVKVRNYPKDNKLHRLESFTFILENFFTNLKQGNKNSYQLTSSATIEKLIAADNKFFDLNGNNNNNNSSGSGRSTSSKNSNKNVSNKPSSRNSRNESRNRRSSSRSRRSESRDRRSSSRRSDRERDYDRDYDNGFGMDRAIPSSSSFNGRAR